MASCLTNHSTVFQDKTRFAVGVTYAVYTPVIFFTNALLITSLITTKQSLKKSANLLIVCLSASDCFIGAALMPILSIENLWHGSAKLCVISWYLQLFLCGVSISFTLLLAVDRYVHMDPNFQRSPSKLSKFFKTPNIYATIITVGILPISLVIAIFHILTLKFPDALNYFSALSAICLVYSIMAFIGFYTRGYLRIRRYVAGNPIYANRRDGQNEVPGYLDELFKTVLILLVAMFFLWVPSIIVSTAMAVLVLMGKSVAQNDILLVFDSISWFLYYANSLVNALILFYRNRQSKEWLFAKVRNIFHAPRIEEEADNVANVNGNVRTNGV